MKIFDCLDPTLDPQGYHALEASAGTGKTFAIQHLVARLVLHGIAIDDILVVTFTRASTRELKSRIRQNLETLFHKNPPYISHLTEEKKIEARFLIDEALALFDQAQIFTIHGFCQRMLTEFGFEAQVGFGLLSEQEENYREILIQEITDFFHTSLPPKSYSTNQLAALMKYCYHDKDKLIRQILQFVEQEGEFPAYLDYQTIEKQYQNIYPTLPKISPASLLRLAPAFLKICNKEGILKKDYQTQFLALSSPSNFDLLCKIRPSLFSFFTEENRSRKNFTPEELEALYTLYDKLHPLLEAATNPEQTLIRIARDAQKKVRQTLLEKELLSPDDLLKHMQQALTHPTFLNCVHQRYRALIIDEFQDTDISQWSIFKRLFVDQPIDAFYIVGDPKQSIYGFRSADLNTYFQAKKSMHQIAHLTTNYRSEPQLLSSLNALFKKQNYFPYQTIQPAPQTTDTLFNDQKKPLHFFIAEVEKKREKNWPSPTIESTYFFPFIAREIQNLTQKKEATFSDFAILVKDRYQADRLKNYLEALNIPLSAKSTEPLTTSPLFIFFTSFLKTLSDPKHIHHLLAHPLFGFTHQELKTNETLLTNASAFGHQLHHLYKTHGFHKTLDAALHHSWKQNQTLFELLVQKGQLDTYSDFMQLAELLIEHATQTKATPIELFHFLQKLPTDKIKYCRRPLSDLNAVTIMTIHMSKGLEFPIVFALGLMNRYTSRQDFIRHQKKWLLFDQNHTTCQAALQDQEKEKLRQLYVALTRAKKRLYIPILQDVTQTPTPLGTASPIELLLDTLPPRQTLFRLINATHTILKEDQPKPLIKTPPILQQPIKPIFHFPTHQIDSFSSLSNHTPPPSPEASESDLPKGVETGLLLHSLLEKIIREKLTHPYDQQAIHILIQKKLKNTPHQPHQQTIKALIDKSFHCPLANFCLADVPTKHLHPETEFLYSQSKTQSIKGFADLIFFHRDTYYLLDWKTNLLEDYTPAKLKTAMQQYDYFLQAQIYLEALKRYLTFKKDPHPIAGAYYLFLRGLPENQGIYFISQK